jgi:hypothetical protein
MFILSDYLQYQIIYLYLDITILDKSLTVLNQIRVVAFNVPQLTQASFLSKKSNVAKCFFDNSNAEMAQSRSSLQKSEFLKLIILIFHVKKLNN